MIKPQSSFDLVHAALEPWHKNYPHSLEAIGMILDWHGWTKRDYIDTCILKSLVPNGLDRFEKICIV